MRIATNDTAISKNRLHFGHGYCAEHEWGYNQLAANLGLTKYADHRAHLEKIAQELFEDGLLQGNWDPTITFDDNKLAQIRCINEDEYEQYMDENDEDTPSWNSRVCRCEFGYIWVG